MELSRRGFLGSMLALAAAPAVVKAGSLMRVYVPPLFLCGHGNRDDSVALQAWVDGKTVLWAEDGRRVSRYIADRDFLLGQALFIRGTADGLIERCCFTMDPNFLDTTPALVFGV